LENVSPRDTNNTNGSILLLRDDVTNLSNKWNSAISLKKALNLLGLDRRIALDLAHAGMIRIVRGPSFDGYRVWRLDRGSVEGYLNKILTHVESNTPPGEIVQLTGAAHITANVGLKAASLLGKVSQGHLTAYRTNSDGSVQLKDLTFLRADIVRLCHKVVKENGWVTKKEIINLMRISSHKLENLIRSGDLTPLSICNNKMYFDLTAIKELSPLDVHIMGGS
jgi:hypothetical protein